jgi:hypothetical protein
VADGEPHRSRALGVRFRPHLIVPFFGGPGPEDTIRKGGAGSVLWLNETRRFNELQRIAVEESRLEIPLLFALDVIHGYRTIFPAPLAMAASWDPSVHERAAAVAQLYVHQKAGSDSRPLRELKGFRRLSLKPAEKQTLTFSLGPEELRYWSTSERKWLQEPTVFDVWVGADATAKALHAELAVVP